MMIERRKMTTNLALPVENDKLNLKFSFIKVKFHQFLVSEIFQAKTEYL